MRLRHANGIVKSPFGYWHKQGEENCDIINIIRKHGIGREDMDSEIDKKIVLVLKREICWKAKEGEYYVIDYCCDSCGFMASWYDYILYFRWIYSHSFSDCRNCDFGANHQRKKDSLTKFNICKRTIYYQTHALVIGLISLAEYERIMFEKILIKSIKQRGILIACQSHH